MSAKSMLPKSIQPGQGLGLILSPDVTMGHGQEKLKNLGVHRIAAAIANGYSKRGICQFLGIDTVTFNLWRQDLSGKDADLLQMSLVDAISELRDDTLSQIMQHMGIQFKVPTKRAGADMARIKANLRGMKLNQLIKVHDMLDKRVLNEVKRIATEKGTTKNNTTVNQIILNGGEGGFMPPSRPSVLEG